MQYLALIHSDVEEWDALSPDAKQAIYAEYGTFAQEGREAGVVVGGSELAAPGDATTVRVRGADTLVTDGPYAEVKEALGGYFLLECASMDEAVSWAARIPAASHGAIEVRQVHVEGGEAS